MNNKQKSDIDGRCKMKKWTKEQISTLAVLTRKEFFDARIAQILSKKFRIMFTPMSVKRKRHRLDFFKKPYRVIGDLHFYVNVGHRKKSSGFTAAFFPISLVEKYGLKNKDFVILKKNDALFISKLTERERGDRPKNNFIFYVPHTLIKSTNYNREMVEYVGKVPTYETRSSEINFDQNTIDLLDLLRNKINSKIKFAPHPFDTGFFLINNGRASIAEKLPRYLSISNEMMQVLGLFQGEGTKNNLRRIEFVNSDVNILNHFLQYFEKSLSIDRNRWKCRVIYTALNRNKTREKTLCTFWGGKLLIKEENFVKVGFWKGHAKAINGSVQLYLPSSSIREAWFNLRKIVPQLIEKDTNYAKWFLQGVLAADGCPIVSDGYLEGIQIRIENKEEGDLYVKALNKLDISSNLYVRTREIKIYRNESISKALSSDLFSLHKERKEKFLKYVPSRKKLKSYIGKYVKTRTDDPWQTN